MLNLRHCGWQGIGVRCLVSVEVTNCIITDNDSLQRSVATLRSFQLEGIGIGSTVFSRYLNLKYHRRHRSYSTADSCLRRTGLECHLNRLCLVSCNELQVNHGVGLNRVVKFILSKLIVLFAINKHSSKICIVICLVLIDDCILIRLARTLYVPNDRVGIDGLQHLIGCVLTGKEHYIRHDIHLERSTCAKRRSHTVQVELIQISRGCRSLFRKRISLCCCIIRSCYHKAGRIGIIVLNNRLEEFFRKLEVVRHHNYRVLRYIRIEAWSKRCCSLDRDICIIVCGLFEVNDILLSTTFLRCDSDDHAIVAVSHINRLVHTIRRNNNIRYGHDRSRFLFHALVIGESNRLTTPFNRFESC